MSKHEDSFNNQIKIDQKWIHQDFEMDEEKLKQQAKEYALLMEEQCRKLFSNFVSKVKTR